MDFLTLAWNKLQAVFDLAFAGAIGALVSLPFHSEVKTFGQRAVMVASGASAAHYITPLALEYFGMAVQRAGSIAFLVGLFGMSMSAAVFKTLKSADITKVIESWLPGRGN